MPDSRTAHHPVRQTHPSPRRIATPRRGASLAAALAVALVAAGALGSTASAQPAAGAQAVLSTAVARPPLTWAPPTLSSPTTVAVSASNRNLSLDVARDYIIDMPSGALTGAGGLSIQGGRNVVLIGGEINIPTGTPVGHAARGIYLKGQTGTVHVEGLLISGGGLTEGFNLDQRLGAVVQIQNVRVETVNGSYSGDHADVIQTWAGPRKLLIDGLSGSSTYQGMFLLPQQFGTQAQPEVFDFRRVNLRGSSTSGYMFWRDSNAWPLRVSDVWVAPKTPTVRDSFLWPKGTGAGTAAWPSVKVGTPPAGDFVAAGAAGLAYATPGYVG